MAAHPGSPALVNTRQRAAINTNTIASHTTIITMAMAPPAALLGSVSWKNMNASWVIAFLLLDSIGWEHRTPKAGSALLASPEDFGNSSQQHLIFHRFTDEV